MALVKVEIADTAFCHAPGMSWYHKPAHIEWVRGKRGDADVCFFTDRCIGQAATHPAKKKVALLIEPRCIDEVGMISLISNLEHSNWVLSYDRDFRNVVTEPGKVLWYPIGGCWIESGSQRLDHNKTVLVSMIASSKASAPGHKLRHIVASTFRDRINVRGRGYSPVNLKSEVLNPSMFSVAIENDIVDDMFTEKIIDCFITGTVPIYWGTSAVNRLFDPRGILTFKTPEDLEHILNQLSADMYASMRNSIVENYYRAMSYRVAEDWLFDNYSALFV